MNVTISKNNEVMTVDDFKYTIRYTHNITCNIQLFVLAKRKFFSGFFDSSAANSFNALSYYMHIEHSLQNDLKYFDSIVDDDEILCCKYNDEYIFDTNEIKTIISSVQILNTLL